LLTSNDLELDFDQRSLKQSGFLLLFILSKVLL